MFVHQVLKEVRLGVSQEALEAAGLSGGFDDALVYNSTISQSKLGFSEGNVSDSPQSCLLCSLWLLGRC